MLRIGSMAGRTKLTPASSPLIKDLLPCKSTGLRSWQCCSSSVAGAGVAAAGWSLPPERDLL